MMPAFSVVDFVGLKETVCALTEGKTLYRLSQLYGTAKDGVPPARGDQYSSTIKRIIADPESAQWGSLRTLLGVLGIDAEAAIEIAASQVKPTTEKGIENLGENAPH